MFGYDNLIVDILGIGVMKKNVLICQLFLMLLILFNVEILLPNHPEEEEISY